MGAKALFRYRAEDTGNKYAVFEVKTESGAVYQIKKNNHRHSSRASLEDAIRFIQKIEISSFASNLSSSTDICRFCSTQNNVTSCSGCGILRCWRCRCLSCVQAKSEENAYPFSDYLNQQIAVSPERLSKLLNEARLNLRRLNKEGRKYFHASSFVPREFFTDQESQRLARIGKTMRKVGEDATNRDILGPFLFNNIENELRARYKAYEKEHSETELLDEKANPKKLRSNRER